MSKALAAVVAGFLGIAAASFGGDGAAQPAPMSAPPVGATTAPPDRPQCHERRFFDLTADITVVNPDGCDARWYVRRGCASFFARDSPIVIRWCADTPEPIPRINVHEAHSITTVPAAPPAARTPFRTLYEIGPGGEATIEMVPCAGAGGALPAPAAC